MWFGMPRLVHLMSIPGIGRVLRAPVPMTGPPPDSEVDEIWTYGSFRSAAWSRNLPLWRRQPLKTFPAVRAANACRSGHRDGRIGTGCVGRIVPGRWMDEPLP